MPLNGLLRGFTGFAPGIGSTGATGFGPWAACAGPLPFASPRSEMNAVIASWSLLHPTG
jgi:hypothetical protein